MTLPPKGQPPSDLDVDRYRSNHRAEIDSATIYHAVADSEKQPQLAALYRKLAQTEEAHAAFWEDQLRRAGQSVPFPRGGLRARTLAWLARRFGARFVLPTVIDGELADSKSYDDQPEARGTMLSAQERSHARLLRVVSGTNRGGLSGAALARLEGRHRSVGGNALRAAVLGANDGLVSNLSLVMGVVGANVPGRGVLITGLAGLIAGAGSMAMGEWLSVQSARELAQRQIDVETDELAAAPEEEAQELALIYEAKGLPPEHAKALADRIIVNEDIALATLAREELGIDPEELGGSAWEAAITSFILFAIGAVVPIVPFIFAGGTVAVVLSVAVSTAALFLIGAGITLLTGRGILYSGGRQLLFGLGAAGLTYVVGRVIGASLGP